MIEKSFMPLNKSIYLMDFIGMQKLIVLYAKGLSRYFMLTFVIKSSSRKFDSLITCVFIERSSLE